MTRTLRNQINKQTNKQHFIIISSIPYHHYYCLHPYQPYLSLSGLFLIIIINEITISSQFHPNSQHNHYRLNLSSSISLSSSLKLTPLSLYPLPHHEYHHYEERQQQHPNRHLPMITICIKCFLSLSL